MTNFKTRRASMLDLFSMTQIPAQRNSSFPVYRRPNQRVIRKRRAQIRGGNKRP